MLITTMSFEVRGAFIKNAHDHKKCATCRIDYRVNDKCAGSVRAMLSGVLVVCPGVPCCVACLLCGVPCSVACYHCYVHVSATLRVVHDHAMAAQGAAINRVGRVNTPAATLDVIIRTVPSFLRHQHVLTIRFKLLKSFKF